MDKYVHYENTVTFPKEYISTCTVVEQKCGQYTQKRTFKFKTWLKANIFNIFHIHYIKGLRNHFKKKEWLYGSWGKMLDDF